MERKRLYGFLAFGVGLVGAIGGRATGSYVLGIVAAVGLLVGGALVAMSYREEAGRAKGGSRLSLVASSLGRSSIATRRDASGEPDDGEAAALVGYAAELNEELGVCEVLVSRPSPEVTAVEAARERLMVLVASPRYGEALRRGFVEEDRVRAVSSRLAGLA